MKIFKLLIVEDNDTIYNSVYLRNIQVENKENEYLNFEVERARTKRETEELLNTKEFDGAIVDLNLSDAGGGDREGNEILTIIKANQRFPVFVITGTPQDIDEDHKGESDLYKIVSRDDFEFLFIEEFKKIFNTGITQILNKKGHIEQYLTKIFWNHLSNSLNLWMSDDSRDSSAKEESLLRYTLLHMQEYIDESIEKYHPAEFYITKPIKKNLFTGDIISWNGSRFIVLTPSCDIVLRKGVRNATNILLLQIKSFKDLNLNLANTSGTNKSKIERYTKNSKQRYHFIPSAGSLEPGIIDFQDKKTVEGKYIDGLLAEGSQEIHRVATVSAPFLKDIISRYSNYYGRQGAPDFDPEEIWTSITKP